jgi:hypothetical protein
MFLLAFRIYILGLGGSCSFVYAWKHTPQVKMGGLAAQVNDRSDTLRSVDSVDNCM